MLSLKNITKDYPVGDDAVHALKGVSIDFRRNEFVSVLGQSGCGKTTLLNIIGGLDRYTDGDMTINGVSTKDYKDADWDSYRNHSIGFVFQSYNLIPHQTVLSNVELALTLSGVSKAERRKRATEALEQVGLGDQLNKKPNQMSGGQMQRVAIARALVNDPDILLADEPTGALDTETSVQIMDILKKISKDKLIIMVTHNPDLANEYSSRIIKLLDGKVTDDSDPYDASADQEAPKAKSKEELKKERKERKKLKTSMSFFTALSLSLNNLMTKKARTLLTSFAGSIGIIGIALILSVANGVQVYIDAVQSDTLSTYPLQIQETNANFSQVMEIMMESTQEDLNHPDDGKIYSVNQMGRMINTMLTETKVNNLTKFKEFLDSNDEIEKYTTDIKYGYSTTLNVFRGDLENGVVQVNPSQVFLNMGMMSETDMMGMSAMGSSFGTDVWTEMLDNEELINSQYQVMAGRMPEKYDEVVLVVSDNNNIVDYVLYSLGILDASELTGFMKRAIAGEEIVIDAEQQAFTTDDFIGMTFRLAATPEFYKKTSDGWTDMRNDEAYMTELLENSLELKIVGVIKPSEDAAAASINQGIAYRPDLMDYLLERVSESEIVKEQLADPDTDVFTGLKFKTADTEAAGDTESSQVEHANAADSQEAQEVSEDPLADLTEEQTAALMRGEVPDDLTDEQLAAITEMYAMMQGGEAPAEDDSTQAETGDLTDEELAALMEQGGTDDAEDLTSMGMDALDGLGQGGMLTGGDFMEGLTDTQREFIGSLTDEQMELMMRMVAESTQGTTSIPEDGTNRYSRSSYETNLTTLGYATIEKPNTINIYPKDFASKEKIVDIIDDYNKTATEEDQIEYTDIVGVMMSSITNIINAISYVLIAFVAISLVVSSIMIGIITYISVLERTKEIGILRSIGASKKDISRVFNAETVIVGFVAGLLGIGISYALTIPINAIIAHLTDVPIRASIPIIAGVILVIISVCLTLIAGLLPSRVAAKKDPVIALRTE